MERPIHLAGVAGSAMSGLARVLRQRGFEVVGTDPRAEEVREFLEAEGVRVFTEQDGSRISERTGLVVTSAALPTDHPELVAARGREIPVISYAEFLGAWMDETDGVAIAGTHGKTTVTAMVVTCLRHTGLRPGFVIGGHVPGLAASADLGDSHLFVAEACEFNRSFLNLSPRLALITNIEEDHLDIYKDLRDIQASFGTFVSRLDERDGVLIHSAECPNTPLVVERAHCERRSFGIDAEATYRARDLRPGPGGTSFALQVQGRLVQEVHLTVPGRHNTLNALAALAVCHTLGVSLVSAAEALARFNGASRRFDLRGEAGGVAVVDDYAHHPTEIDALLRAARTRFPGRRLVAVFQPHQHSRTRFFLNDFAQVLLQADLVLIPDIYAARDTEEDKRIIGSKDLVDRVAALNGKAEYLGGLEGSAERILERTHAGDVLLMVGAGNIDSIIPRLLGDLSRRERT